MYQDERRLDFHALGREIKRKREAKGWTQEYLAQLVDRTPRSIMYFENRGQHPSLNAFYQMVNVIVNVLLVYMGTDEELILALCPAHRRFIADAVGLLRRHLAVGERLPDLVAQRPVSGPAVSFALILIFDQHELGVCRGRIAEVGGNGPQLLRVQAIVKAVFQALQGRPLIGPLVGFEVGCGRRQPSFPYDKRRLGSAAVFCIFWPP